MTDCWKHGIVGPSALGEHIVMPRRTSAGSTVHGVWVVRSRSRSGEGSLELLAEFRSKRFANEWCKQRNTRRA